MSGRNIVLAALGLLIIGGGIWWFTSSGNGGDQTSQSQEQAAQPQDSASINELLARNQNLMCTYSTTDEQGNINSGTVYFSNGRMSGDFLLTSPGAEPVASHVINDGQYQYLWQEGENEGIRVSLDQFDGQTDETEGQPSGSVDQDEDFDFDCADWSVDESRFMPPNSVNFVDYSQEFQQAQEEAAGAAEETCSQITNPDARAACEAAL